LSSVSLLSRVHFGPGSRHRRSSFRRHFESNLAPSQSGAASVSRSTGWARRSKGPRESVTRFEVNYCYLSGSQKAKCRARNKLAQARHYYRHSGQHSRHIPTPLRSIGITHHNFESVIASPPRAVILLAMSLESERCKGHPLPKCARNKLVAGAARRIRDLQGAKAARI